VKEETEKKFETGGEKAVGSLMFLRFLSPALVAPHQYGLASHPPSPPMQRKLVLVTKVLQNLANGVQFGSKEDFMTVLNSFLDENKTTTENFLTAIADEPSDWRSLLTEPVAIPQSVKDNALWSLRKILVNHKKVLFESLKADNEETLKKLEAVLADNAEPKLVE